MYFYLSKLLTPILNPINALVIIFVILTLINLKYKNKKIKFISNLFLIIFLFISFFPIGKLGIKYLENNYIVQKNIDNIDNLIVLGGAEDFLRTKQFKKLSLNSSSERLISIVKLSNLNFDAKIFYLGGNGNLNQRIDLNEIDVAKQFFQDVNFDLNKITFVGKTRNTIENFQKLKENYKIENDKSVLVTSASHMNRSLIISKYFGYDFIPYAVDFKTQPKTNKINYYQSFNIISNLSSFNVFFREILGILGFKLFY